MYCIHLSMKNTSLLHIPSLAYFHGIKSPRLDTFPLHTPQSYDPITPIIHVTPYPAGLARDNC